MRSEVKGSFRGIKEGRNPRRCEAMQRCQIPKLVRLHCMMMGCGTSAAPKMFHPDFYFTIIDT